MIVSQKVTRVTSQPLYYSTKCPPLAGIQAANVDITRKQQTQQPAFHESLPKEMADGSSTTTFYAYIVGKKKCPSKKEIFPLNLGRGAKMYRKKWQKSNILCSSLPLYTPLSDYIAIYHTVVIPLHRNSSFILYLDSILMSRVPTVL